MAERFRATVSGKEAVVVERVIRRLREPILVGPPDGSAARRRGVAPRWRWLLASCASLASVALLLVRVGAA
ncbi:MAG TPA: hypothetical protein VHK22_08520 [Gaiellaceae bacterium]|nr:hypothetical protein [Gaiellaceae bacterium]